MTETRTIITTTTTMSSTSACSKKVMSTNESMGQVGQEVIIKSIANSSDIINENNDTCQHKMSQINEESDSQDDVSEKFIGPICECPCKHCPYYLMGRLMPSTGSIGDLTK